MPENLPATPVKNESRLPYLWMLAGSVAFAVMASLAHTLRESCDWPLLAIVRSGLALLFAAALARAAGAQLVFWRPRTLWLRSSAGSVSMVCTFYAFTRLPPSDVLTLTNMFPVWVALLSWPLLGEVPTVGVWLAVVSALAGVVLIQEPHLAAGNFATLIAAGSSLFTAVAMLGLHRLRDVDPRAIVVHFSAVALVFCTAALFLFGGTVPLGNLADGGPLVLLLALGVSATIGQLFLTKAFTFGSPMRVSVVGLTQIVFALLLDLLLLGHSLRPMSLLGMALVMAPTGWLMMHRPVSVVAVVEDCSPGDESP